ncbi:chondroitin lyase [Agarivorans sp. B2Z047]|uniref:heparinase II/III domain-containing protein n=1 Tax=Agarivorans sp. B2Z047 TaxID=2652721 RepID=UPI00128B5480|nr:heparinase II/III family protein [Agarivorans sp. B2Z047]MPW29429.1 chondroitin lyase [Agarivorans sp. B2Z047]UQN45018.1 heparinase II/III family protein [Agarivorans sp. B2Z047]
MTYQPLLISFEEAKELAKHLNTDSLIGQSIAAEVAALEAYMPLGIEIPGHGEAGGYEHNRHKQNYIHLDLAGRLYLITEDQRYLDYARSMLVEYAKVYPTLELNTSRDSNPPGRLFHQTLNENMWMLYASCAYSCIRHKLAEDEQTLIENDLFKLMIELFVDVYAHDFDIVHNHGLWAVAGVGICGYAIQDQASVDKALYGLKGDSVSGGFIAQLTQLFSPDGYYMEGPYYHRFSLRPIFLFAEAIERRQPEIGIYQLKDQVIKTTTYAVMATAFPNGVLPALNDSSKTMDINDEGILIATSMCFSRYQRDANLVAMAKHQAKVWVHGSGASLSDASENAASIGGFNWGSLVLTDGAEGDRGGVAILRHRDAQQDDSMALLWFGQHGSDHKLHSALDHGHFDGLHFNLFNRGQEVLHDYGFGRWVNVEPKFGGRYIPENKSYAKQTIAHNTVVVDYQSQNQGDTATAEEKWGEQHFFVSGDNQLQAMSAFVRNYYPGVDQQRSVIMFEAEGFAKPLVLDLFRLVSEQEHNYDYALHYSGQFIRSDFNYECNARLKPLGENNGYQHLWHQATAEVEGSSLITWLQGNSYYTMVSSAVTNSQVIMARTGANDPDFNLRSEPVLLLRQQGKNHLFANVFETHGYFNEAIEASTEARGQVTSVEVLAHNKVASAVAIHLVSGKQITVCVSNQANVKSDTQHQLEINGETLRWSGAVHIA